MDIPGVSKKMFDEAMRTQPLVNAAIQRMRLRLLGASAVVSDTCETCDKYDTCDDAMVLDVPASLTILTACLNQTVIQADKKAPVPDVQLGLFFELLELTSQFGGAGAEDWGDDRTISQVLQDENLYPDDDSVDELERVGKHIADKLVTEIEPDDTKGAERDRLALAVVFMLTSEHLASVMDQGGLSDTGRVRAIVKMEDSCVRSLEDDRAKRKLH